MGTSENIRANVGAIDALEYQDNGTDRLKGSFPHLITSADQISDHLNSAIPVALKEHTATRLSSRYFVTDSAIKELDNVAGEYSGLKCKVEAAISLGNIFDKEGVDQSIWWVWIGGNDPRRILSGSLRGQLMERFHRSDDMVRNDHNITLPDNYEALLLGTERRLQRVDVRAANIVEREITRADAKQIARLYSQRMPVYVADNGNPDYIINTVADSADTELFVIRDNRQGEIVACASNEYTNYPLQIENKKSNIPVCESNDWVKRRDIAREVFLPLVGITLKHAIRQNVKVIEAECVPESFKIAGELGYQPAGLLERTSHMLTDGLNLERDDSSVPEAFRKYNSLWLYTMTPQSTAWDYWKIL